MKATKTILIIDDKDQSSEIEEIKESLDDLFEIKCKCIWVAKPQFRANGSNHPDINKLKNEIKLSYDEYGKHSKKCTFYTLRFGCSFAAVNTIKPQLL